MTTTNSCSWCHTDNPVDQPMCRVCRHDAHVSRWHCRCDRCQRSLADAVARQRDETQALFDQPNPPPTQTDRGAHDDLLFFRGLLVGIGLVALFILCVVILFRGFSL